MCEIVGKMMKENREKGRTEICGKLDNKIEIKAKANKGNELKREEGRRE